MLISNEMLTQVFDSRIRCKTEIIATISTVILAETQSARIILYSQSSEHGYLQGVILGSFTLTFFLAFLMSSLRH